MSEGQRLGNYRLHRLLGKGSFAEVYLGEHLYLNTYAAIKVLHTTLSEKEEALFLAEARTIAQLAHPHIVQVREFAIERSISFLVMDYAPGGTLRHRYPRSTCLAVDTTVNYVKQIAAALQYAHNQGIIHRDVKPENILQGAGQVLLSDFGISLSAPKPNATTSQSWAGTFGYMAPEQFQGQAVFASDQYALAVLTYEWLCGVRPFEGSGTALVYQHAHVPPPRLRERDPSLPEAVEAVVLKALSKRPEERYVSILNFARALERASRGETSYDIGAYAETEAADAPPPTLARRIFLSQAVLDDSRRLQSDLSIRDITIQGQEDKTRAVLEEQTRQAIRAAQMVLLLLTPHTRSSPAVQNHLRIAHLYRRKIICLWTQGEALQDLLPAGAQQAMILDARGQHYQQALDQIVLALDREQRGVSNVAPPLSALDFEPRNPYKGLRAFTQQDRADFFGRHALVQELLTLFKQQIANSSATNESRPRLLAVVGPGGSGKSSVVMAGLLPILREGALPDSEHWIYLEPMVPDKQPLDALTQLLVARFPEQDPQALRQGLGREGGFGLHQLALSLMSQPETRIVVTIDQFEELFSSDIPEPERAQFIQLLVTAATEPRGPVLALLTLRADFYDRPFVYPALGRLIQQQQCAVLPMSASDLREVIERPALLSDVRLLFDEDLVGDLLFDMRGQSGALPLLEFALEQLFHHRRDRRLTWVAYQEIGGVRGALSKHAEAIYASLASEEHRRLARTLFLRLVQHGAQGQEPVRRRADLSEFALANAEQTHMLREVIDTFIAARLLTVHQFIGASALEISHEALIREWPRLLSWLQEAREDMQLQQALSQDVREWERRGKPKDRLYRGSQLKELLAWQQHNTASGNEATFLRASTARRSWERISLFLVALLLLAILLPAAVFLQQQLTPPTVTTLQDDVPGSLRQAITNARPGATIRFDANLKGTLVLNKSLVISKDLTLRGPGVNQLTIRGTRDQGYLIYVPHHSTVTIAQVTFSDPTPAIGPVIINEGTLTLETCHITGNAQTGKDVGSGTAARGGGIENNGGTLTLRNSLVSHNTITADMSTGGGIDTDDGTLILENSQVVDNTAVANGYATGGGVGSRASKITLINSSISRNRLIGQQTTTEDSILEGGGIDSTNDSITLKNSSIADNSITGNSVKDTAVGGGIAIMGGAITISNSQLTGNTIVTQDNTFGGAINVFPCPKDICPVNSPSVTIEKSIISKNRVKSLQKRAAGGGIFSPFLTITDSIVSENSVNASSTDLYGAAGGGINIEILGKGIMTQGSLTLNRTTISGNTVKNSKGGTAGGGLFAYETSTSTVQLNLTNCTIANNKVEGGSKAGGGGLALRMLKTHNNRIDFCTIYGNVASQGGGIATNWIDAPKIPDLSLKNSIVAGNFASTAPDISGAITTEGYNLVQSFIGTLVNDTLNKHKTDISGGPFPNLGINAQLSNNGGPTLTLALQADSPAIDAIPATACDVSTDQRGVKRPQHNACDIGSYEYE